MKNMTADEDVLWGEREMRHVMGLVLGLGLTAVSAQNPLARPKVASQVHFSEPHSPRPWVTWG